MHDIFIFFLYCRNSKVGVQLIIHLRKIKYAEKIYAVLKRKMLITTKLPLGTVFSVLGPSNRISYHAHSLGALSGPIDGDHDCCTPCDGVTYVYCSSNELELSTFSGASNIFTHCTCS